jgi:hypothetical protein
MTIEQFGIVFGVVASLATGLVFLLKEYQKKQKRNRKKLHRLWTNEGQNLWPDIDSHKIFLNLKVDESDGQIVGTLEVTQLRFNYESPLGTLNVGGSMKYNSAILTIFKGRKDSFFDFGKAKIKLRKKQLFWELIEGDEFFPSKAILEANWEFARDREFW